MSAKDRGARARHRAQAGFSLIEVVVAMAIAGGSLGAFYAVGGTATRLQIRVESQAAVTAIALDLLASVGSDVALAPGRNTGRAADGSVWLLEIEPQAALAIEGRNVVLPHLLRARVTVEAARGGGRIMLEALRLARSP
jgi:prepilin-type N-terminal cleavage/methylation domain-containing protein